MTVPMTDDQLQVLIATMRGITDGDQRMDLLRSWAGAELTDPWEKEVRKGCKATREEEAAVPTHTCERVVESTELTPHKLDQVRPGMREGEVAVQAHTCERGVESTEPTQLGLDTEATREVEMNKIRLKLDRMGPGTREWEVAMQAYTYGQVWPGTREGEVAVQAHTYEREVESTEQTQLKQDTEATREVEHRLDIEATREGEVAEAAHTEEQVVESKELTIPKLDQVDQVKGGDPDDKGKGEKETSSESSDNEEEEEINQVIQDQVRPGTCGTARMRDLLQTETEDIGVKNQEKPDIHQAKTEGTEYQAKANGGVKNEGIGVKNHDFLQAETKGISVKDYEKQNDSLQAETGGEKQKTEGTEYQAKPRKEGKDDIAQV